MAVDTLKLKVDMDNSGLKAGAKEFERAGEQMGKSLQKGIDKSSKSDKIKERILDERYGLDERREYLKNERKRLAGLQKRREDELRYSKHADVSEYDTKIATSEGNIAQAKTDIIQITENIRELRRELAAAQKEEANVGSASAGMEAVSGTVNKIGEKTKELAKSAQDAAQAEKQLAGATRDEGNAQEEAAAKTERHHRSHGRGLASMIRSVFIYRTISRMLNMMRAGLANVITSDSAMAASLASIRGSLYSAFAPIVSFVLPALRSLLAVLAQVMAAIAHFIGAIFGMSGQAQATAGSLLQQAAATEAAGGAAGGAAKTIAAFDEINQMNDSGGGGGGGGGGLGYDFTGAAESIDLLNDKFRETAAIVAGIAAGILAWKLSGSFLTGLKWFLLIKTTVKSILNHIKMWKDGLESIDLGNLHLDDLKAIFAGWLINPKLGGIIALVEGLSNIAASIKDIVENGPSLDNIGNTIFGIGESLMGFGLITSNPFIIAIGAIVAGLGDILSAVKDIIENGPSIENIARIIRDIALVVAVIAFMTGHPIIGVIALIVAGIALLAEKWTWFKENVLQPVVDWAKKIFDTTDLLFIGIALGVVVLGALFAKFKSGITGAIKTIGKFGIKALAFVAFAIAIGSAIAELVKGWQEGLDSINFDKLYASEAAAVGAAGLAFGSVGAGVTAIGLGIADVITGLHDMTTEGQVTSENLSMTIGGLGATIAGIGILLGNWPLALIGAAVYGIGYLIKKLDIVGRLAGEYQTDDQKVKMQAIANEQAFTVPFHFEDVSGQWQDTLNTLVEKLGQNAEAAANQVGSAVSEAGRQGGLDAADAYLNAFNGAMEGGMSASEAMEVAEQAASKYYKSFITEIEGEGIIKPDVSVDPTVTTPDADTMELTFGKDLADQINTDLSDNLFTGENSVESVMQKAGIETAMATEGEAAGQAYGEGVLTGAGDVTAEIWGGSSGGGESHKRMSQAKNAPKRRGQQDAEDYKAGLESVEINTDFGDIATDAQTAMTTVITIFQNAQTTITAIMTNIGNVIRSAFSSSGSVGASISAGLSSMMRRYINGMISGINSSFGVIDSLTSQLSRLKSIRVGGSFPFASIPTIRIPRIAPLAQGAVIPANNRFLAMLGDQTSGTNIEAPLDTIVEAVRTALGGNGGNTAQEIRQALQGMHIEVNKRVLGYLSADGINENRRIDGKLALNL